MLLIKLTKLYIKFTYIKVLRIQLFLKMIFPDDFLVNIKFNKFL